MFHTIKKIYVRKLQADRSNIIPWSAKVLLSTRLIAASLLLMPIAMAQGQAIPVHLEAVQQQQLQQRVRVTGSLRAQKSGQVSNLEAGRLIKLNVREGQEVKKGAVIAQIDSRRLEQMKQQTQSAIKMAKAVLLRREAELEDAKSELESRQIAAKQNAVSRNRLRRGKTDFAVAKANLAEAESGLSQLNAELELLEIRLADTQIKAPYDAFVVAQSAELGEWLRQGDPIVELSSKAKLEAWLEIPQRYLHKFNNKQNIEVELGNTSLELANSSFKVIRRIDTRSRTFYIVADLNSQTAEKLQLMPGLAIHAWIAAGPKQDYLTVPKNAVIQRQGMSYVFKKNAQGLAEQVAVNLEFSNANRFVIALNSRLSAKSLVVTEGNERLLPATPIKALNNN